MACPVFCIYILFDLLLLLKIFRIFVFILFGIGNFVLLTINSDNSDARQEFFEKNSQARTISCFIKRLKHYQTEPHQIQVDHKHKRKRRRKQRNCTRSQSNRRFGNGRKFQRYFYLIFAIFSISKVFPIYLFKVVVFCYKVLI